MVNTEMQNSNARIAKNTLLLFVRMLFSMGISLYTTRAILQILGVTDFGIYNVVGGVIVLFGFLSQTMSTTTSRFITTALGKNDTNALHKVFCMSMNFHIVIALLTLVVGETVGLWFVVNKLVIPVDRLTAAFWLYQASILGTCVSVLSVPYNATIIAYERMGAFAYISILQVIAKLVIVLLLPYFPTDRLIAFSVLTVVVSLIIQVIYWQYSYRNFQETHFQWLWNKKIWKEMSGFASWNITGDLAYVCNTQGLNILLNMFYGPVINAARGVAVQVESVVTQFIGNYQTAVSPQITKSYAAGAVEQTCYLTLKSSKFCFYLMMILGIPAFLEMEYVLEVWLHEVPDHTVAFAKLTILMMVADCLSRPLHLAIFATGLVRKYRILQSSIYLFFLPLSYIILKFLVVPPEFILILLVLFKFLVLVVCIERVKRLLQISIHQYVKEVMIPSLSCLILSLIFPVIVVMIYSPSFSRLCLTVFISLVSSIVVIYTIGLTSNEKRTVVNQIHKLLSKY